VARDVLVVGAGIVGVSIARELAHRGVRVTVLDRDSGQPRGSTMFAPGFVGLYNDMPLLTDLAVRSAASYDTVPVGFTRPGGLELATTDAGAAEVARRVEAARAAGLGARLVGPSELPEQVAGFVDADRVVAAASFPDDGTADAPVLIRVLRERAVGEGVRFLYGHEVTGIDRQTNRVTVVAGTGAVFTADDLVLAGGVWGPSLTALTGRDLPLFPVAHPYVYSASDASWRPGPFVRWPEHHVYARVHRDRLGIGSYDHTPIPIGQDGLADGAGLAWDETFGPVIDTAQELMSAQARFAPEHRINGVFAVTPDNLPFLGPHPDLNGVWIAQAIWITHAAGAAAMLVDAMADAAQSPPELAIDRFDGDDPNELRTRALRLYRDIYANDSA